MMPIVAVLAGALLGGASGDGFGAAVGALLGWLLYRQLRQERRIAALERALALRPAARPSPTLAHADPQTAAEVGAERPPAHAAPAPDAPPAASEAAMGAARALPALPSDATVAPEPAMPAPPASAQANGAEAAAPWPSAPAEPMEPWSPASGAAGRGGALAALRSTLKNWLFGGNTIVKAGVSILFVGLAFLAKYASEHVHVPVELRLAAIGAVAVALLAVGWRLRERRAEYAQVLQGGAVAVLYLTLFVSFRFYGVLPLAPVFALMVVVAALSAALAVLQDARSLAIVGALGGFATPLLVSSGEGNQVALFSYYLVLDLGIAAVAWYRTWRMLNLIGFFATFLVGSAWGVTRYEPEHYASSQAFLVAYFVLFNAILMMPARRLGAGAEGPSTRADAWVQGTLMFGLPTITFALQHGLVRDTEYGTALSALAMAAFYVAMGWAMRGRARLAVTFEASLAIAVVFLTLVIPFAFDARSTAGAWALEGAGLVWLGVRQVRALPRAFGYALLVLAGLAMMAGHAWHGAPTTVFNAYLFNALMAAAASLAAAYFARSAALAALPARGRYADAESLAEPLLIGWATLWAIVAAAVQIDNFVPQRYALAGWLVASSAIALVFAGLSVRLDWSRAAWPAVGHAPLLALGVLGSTVALASPADNGGWWAWPLALATHLALLRLAAPRWPDAVARVVHVLGVLVLAGLGALQGRAVTSGWADPGRGGSAWHWLGWLAVPALLLLLLVRPAVARRWPVAAAPSAYRGAAAAVLTAGLLLWTLAANVVCDGSARPLPFVPLLNPLDLGVALALVAAWRWFASDEGARLVPSPAVGNAALGACGFVWLNAMLIRAFHHFGGVPFRVDAWLNSVAVQTGLSLLWTAAALVLMWLSARRALRMPWMVGAVLLGAVVVKLLVFDLSGSGTVARIVSFIGVGVLMLVIGYVAPLPAKALPKAPFEERPGAAG